MKSGAHRCGDAPPSGQAGRVWPVPLRQSGFTLIELIAVIVILGILAALIYPRYVSMTEQAAQSAAQGASAEGYSRLTLATARYIADNRGAQPQALADLSPDYLNATDSLGEYTAVFTQGSGQVIVDIFPGAGTSGTPLTSRSINWP